MADGGPPIPQTLAAVPAVPAVSPALPTQLATPPVQPAAPPVQPGSIQQLNWSHFKLEFAGKPDENAEAHLLRRND